MSSDGGDSTDWEGYPKTCRCGEPPVGWIFADNRPVAACIVHTGEVFQTEMLKRWAMQQAIDAAVAQHGGAAAAAAEEEAGDG